MLTFILMCVLLGVFALIALYIYARVIGMHMTAAAAAVNKPALLSGTTGLTWLSTKLMGWKTILLGWAAAAVQAFSLLLSTDLSPFKDLPWTLVFEQHIANYVTFALAMLATVTHAMGLSKAAATPPQD